MEQISGQLLGGLQSGTQQDKQQKARLLQQWDSAALDRQQRAQFNETATTLRESGLSQGQAQFDAAQQLRVNEEKNRADFRAQTLANQRLGNTVRQQTSQRTIVERPDGTFASVPKPGTAQYVNGVKDMASAESSLSAALELRDLFAEHGTEAFGNVKGRMKTLHGQIMSQIASVLNKGGVLSPGEIENIKNQFASPGGVLAVHNECGNARPAGGDYSAPVAVIHHAGECRARLGRRGKTASIAGRA